MGKHLYFVWDGGKYVKIGMSEDPARRLGQLQTSSPHRLLMLGWMPCDEEDEKDAHLVFGHGHVLGEWFRASAIRPFEEWWVDTKFRGTYKETIQAYIEDINLEGEFAGILYDRHCWADALQKSRPA